MKAMTAEQFLKDVATHTMTVKLDNGLYRHLLFRGAKDSWNQWYEIVTWPNGLTINGDMGTWSFSRIEDMFDFFRHGQDGTIKINEYYWSEKITSESRFGGPHKKFVTEVFKANVLRHLKDCEVPEPENTDILEALDEEVFSEDYGDDESAVRRALADFKHGDFQFTDSWEIGGDAYTYHFLWCLYAIVWSIQQYDQIKAMEIA